jgi:hypothetical protein
MTRRPHNFATLTAAVGLLALFGGCGKADSARSGRATTDPPQAVPHTTGRPDPADLPIQGIRPRSSPRAETLLRAAIQTLETRDSISAKVRQEVHLFGKRPVGSGAYLQQRTARGDLMRWEMVWQLGELSTSLVQVTDGEYLWIHSSLSDPPLTRIDARRVAEKLGDLRTPGISVDMGGPVGMGGFVRLLRTLDEHFEFHAAQPGRWGRQKQPVWRLQGTWKPQRLAELLPGQREAALRGEPVDLAQLSEQLPAEVALLLGQEDLFPYRIEYRRKERHQAPEEPAGRLMTAIDFYEVSINVPIDPARFRYHPGKMPWSDGTEAYIQSFGLDH